MSWTPPHDNFTTFVKDNNNIYIKCADGSWIVLTLSPNPVGPFGGGGVGGEDGYKKKLRYRYLQETWEVIGQRAIPDEMSSDIIASRLSEVTVFGIQLLGGRLEEIRNVFELSGTISDNANRILEIYGTKSEYLHTEYYSFGKKLAKHLKNVPIIGSKRDVVELEYLFKGTISDSDVLARLIQGIKRNEINKLIVASGKTAIPMRFSTAINGAKVEDDTKEVAVIGKKDFRELLEILLMQI